MIRRWFARLNAWIVGDDPNPQLSRLDRLDRAPRDHTEVHIERLPDTAGGHSLIAVEVEHRHLTMHDGRLITQKVVRPIMLGHTED
jgi:hypothetical protein